MFKFNIVFFASVFLIFAIYGISLPTNNSPIGPCLGDMCMEGYECKDNLCYPISLNDTNIKNSVSKTVGPCVNGACPDGYVCKEDSCYLEE
uniref:CC domain-containing protein n=1 Tax=Strongyloides stercoralis TaxID=6248 RepID=A0A0K0ELD0_STRER